MSYVRPSLMRELMEKQGFFGDLPQKEAEDALGKQVQICFGEEKYCFLFNMSACVCMVPAVC